MFGYTCDTLVSIVAVQIKQYSCHYWDSLCVYWSLLQIRGSQRGGLFAGSLQ